MLRLPSIFRHYQFVVLSVALIGAGMVVMCPEDISVPYLAPSENTVRLVRDDHDRSIYMQRGSFVTITGARPYRDVFSEYPQLATYLFALPYVYGLVHTVDKDIYLAVLSVMMALSLGMLAFVWLALAREIGVSEKRVLFLLLPGTLYFTLNRFDVVPALLTLSALYLLVKQRTTLAHVFLALAVLTKAYPLLYLPLFVIESLRQGGKRKVGVGLGTFAAVLLGFSAQLALWAGPTAIVAPFAWQLGRTWNDESLYYFASRLLPWLTEVLKPAFLMFQGVLPVAFFVIRPSSPRALVRWAAAITMAFVTFARFQSPQWTVWIHPLALLAASNKRELVLAVLLDLLSYVYFPLAYDLAPRWFLALLIATLSVVRIVLMLMFLHDPDSESLTRRGSYSIFPDQRFGMIKVTAYSG